MFLSKLGFEVPFLQSFGLSETTNAEATTNSAKRSKNSGIQRKRSKSTEEGTPKKRSKSPRESSRTRKPKKSVTSMNRNRSVGSPVSVKSRTGIEMQQPKRSSVKNGEVAGNKEPADTEFDVTSVVREFRNVEHYNEPLGLASVSEAKFAQVHISNDESDGIRNVLRGTPVINVHPLDEHASVPEQGPTQVYVFNDVSNGADNIKSTAKRDVAHTMSRLQGAASLNGTTPRTLTVAPALNFAPPIRTFMPNLNMLTCAIRGYQPPSANLLRSGLSLFPLQKGLPSAQLQSSLQQAAENSNASAIKASKKKSMKKSGKKSDRAALKKLLSGQPKPDSTIERNSFESKKGASLGSDLQSSRKTGRPGNRFAIPKKTYSRYGRITKATPTDISVMKDTNKRIEAEAQRRASEILGSDSSPDDAKSPSLTNLSKDQETTTPEPTQKTFGFGGKSPTKVQKPFGANTNPALTTKPALRMPPSTLRVQPILQDIQSIFVMAPSGERVPPISQ